MTHFFPKKGIDNAHNAIKAYISTQSSCIFLILPKHGSDRPYRSKQRMKVSVLDLAICKITLPGSANPVVSKRIKSKLPFFCMSFSIAATPVSLILQHRHPFGSSKKSCASSPGLLSSVETFIALPAGSICWKYLRI